MDADEDPWADLLSRFRLSCAQITAAVADGPMIVEADLTVVVEEGRRTQLLDVDLDRPERSRLAYLGSVTVEGAAAVEAFTGVDAQVVITGLHRSGATITIAGKGAIWSDGGASVEVTFETMPEMVVIDRSTDDDAG